MSDSIVTYQSDELRTFAFGTNEVRVHVIDGEPWFLAKDVCECLGISNHRDALSRLDDDEKGVGTADTPGGRQETAVISEAGMYSLVLTSRKDEAKSFKRWVTHEVLPAIRKDGSYSATKPIALPSDPLALALHAAAEARIAICSLESKQIETTAELATIRAEVVPLSESVAAIQKELLETSAGTTDLESCDYPQLRSLVVSIVRASGDNFEQRFHRLYEDFAAEHDLAYEQLAHFYGVKILTKTEKVRSGWKMDTIAAAHLLPSLVRFARRIYCGRAK